MILSVNFQLEIFFTTIFLGFIIGFLYDIVRVFRIFTPHNRILVDIEDIIFWTAMSIIVFLISLYKNDGDIRLFFIAGLFIGMILYFCAISKMFLKCSTYIIQQVKKLILVILYLVSLPLKIAVFPVILSFKFLKNILIKTKLYAIIGTKFKFLEIMLSKAVNSYKRFIRKNTDD